MGKQIEYTKKLADEICEAIANSPYMLEDLCDEHEDWPTAKTIYTWRRKYKEFADLFTIAKQEQIEVLVSRALRICRDRSNDFVEDPKGNWLQNTPRIQGIRSEVDLIKWLAGKLAPKLYGERKKPEGDDNRSLLSQVIDEIEE